MHDLGKIKRQIEIVGLCAGANSILRPVDLATLYDCEELTIKRDLSDLRGIGVPIHSGRKNGIMLEAPLPARRVHEMVTQYLGICNASSPVDKATALLVRARRQKALRIVVLLQHCIESRLTALVNYIKVSNVFERDREIEPLQLFQSEGSWRVLAQNDGRVKQYHLHKLRNVRVTQRSFRPAPREQIDAMFRHSFRSWIGTEAHTVRIRLNSVWANRLKPRQLMESQILHEEEGGSVIFETTVNSLDEIASWVVSRGEGVTVLEPETLRQRVLELARGALRNYEPSGTTCHPVQPPSPAFPFDS